MWLHRNAKKKGTAFLRRTPRTRTGNALAESSEKRFYARSEPVLSEFAASPRHPPYCLSLLLLALALALTLLRISLCPPHFRDSGLHLACNRPRQTPAPAGSKGGRLCQGRRQAAGAQYVYCIVLSRIAWYRYRVLVPLHAACTRRSSNTYSSFSIPRYMNSRSSK